MRDHWKNLAAAGWLLLLINTAYIAAFPSPTLFYMGNVVLHLALGLALTVAVVRLWRRGRAAAGAEAAARAGASDLGAASLAGSAAVWLLVIAAAAGVALAVAGNTTPHRWLLWTHIGSAVLAVVAGLVYLQRQAAARGGA